MGADGEFDLTGHALRPMAKQVADLRLRAFAALPIVQSAPPLEQGCVEEDGVAFLIEAEVRAKHAPVGGEVGRPGMAEQEDRGVAARADLSADFPIGEREREFDDLR